MQPGRDVFDDLIKGLEQAVRDSAILDARIARDIAGVEIHDWPGWIKTKSRMQDFPALTPTPAYTASLDEAVSLVPLGWSWRIAVSEQHNYPIVTLGRSYPTNSVLCSSRHKRHSPQMTTFQVMAAPHSYTDLVGSPDEWSGANGGALACDQAFITRFRPCH
jgi:hypothetical protein